MQTITVKIPDEMAKFLEHIAAEEERSKSYYIRKAIAQYMEDLADLYVAKRESAKIKKGEKTIPLAVLMKRNGLLDN